jgi:tetratricopeptide (TPR) repeat protein
VTFITVLHPWPLHWNYWADWEQELSFAIDIVQAPEHKAELLTYLADMMFLTGRRDATLNLGKQAISYAHTACAVIPLARAGIQTASILLQRKEARAAADIVNLVEQVIAKRETSLKQDSQVVTARAYLAVYKARELRLENHWAAALALLDDVIEQFKLTSKVDSNIVADCYSARSVLFWLQGEALLAIEDLNQAINLVSMDGYEFAENAFRGNLGLCYWSIGELKQAKETMFHCIRVAEQSKIYYWLVFNIGNLAMVFLSEGRIQEALVMGERHIALAKNHSSPAENMRASDNYGVVKFHAGDYKLAQNILEQNVPFYETQIGKADIVIQLVNISRCHAALGETDQAISLAEKAFDYAEQQSYPSPKIVARRCLAETQSPGQGKVLLEQALMLSRQYHRRLDEAACLLSLAMLQENEDDKKELWEEGMKILNIIGASLWLDGCSRERPPKIPFTF